MARLDTVRIHSKKLNKTMTVNAVDWGTERLRAHWERLGYKAIGESHGDATPEEEANSERQAASKEAGGTTSQTADTEGSKKTKKKKTKKKAASKESEE